MFKSLYRIVILTAMFTMFTVSTVFASTSITTVSQEQAKQGMWEQTENTWRFKKDNVYLTSSWIESQTTAGTWYYVDENGVMLVNATTPDGYRVDNNGVYQATASADNTSTNRDSKVTSDTVYTDPTVDEGLKLIQEAINNGYRVGTEDVLLQ